MDVIDRIEQAISEAEHIGDDAADLLDLLNGVVSYTDPDIDEGDIEQALAMIETFRRSVDALERRLLEAQVCLGEIVDIPEIDAKGNNENE